MPQEGEQGGQGGQAGKGEKGRGAGKGESGEGDRRCTSAGQRQEPAPTTDRIPKKKKRTGVAHSSASESDSAKSDSAKDQREASDEDDTEEEDQSDLASGDAFMQSEQLWARQCHEHVQLPPARASSQGPGSMLRMHRANGGRPSRSSRPRRGSRPRRRRSNMLVMPRGRRSKGATSSWNRKSSKR